MFPPTSRFTGLTAAVTGLIVGIGYLLFYTTNLYRFAIGAFVVAAVVLSPLTIVPLLREYRSWLPGLCLFLGYFAYAAISCFRVPDPEAALTFLGLSFVAVAPALAVGLQLGTIGSVRPLYVVVGCIVVAFASQSAIFSITAGDAAGVEQGTFRTILGGVLCFATPMIVARATLGRWRIAWAALALICLALVVIIQSRAAPLLVAPAVLLVLWFRFRAEGILAVVLGVIVAALMMIAGVVEVPERLFAEATYLDISQAADTPSLMEVDPDRRLQSSTAATLFLENPMFGAGFAAVEQVNEAEYGRPVSAHGFVPGLAGEVGIAGLALVFAFVASCALRIRKAVLAAATGSPERYLMTAYGIGFAALVGFGFVHQLPESPLFALLAGASLTLAPRLASIREDRATLRSR